MLPISTSRRWGNSTWVEVPPMTLVGQPAGKIAFHLRISRKTPRTSTWKTCRKVSRLSKAVKAVSPLETCRFLARLDNHPANPTVLSPSASVLLSWSHLSLRSASTEDENIPVDTTMAWRCRPWFFHPFDHACSSSGYAHVIESKRILLARERVPEYEIAVTAAQRSPFNTLPSK